MKKRQQCFLLTTTKCRFIDYQYFPPEEFNVVTCDDGDKAVDEYIRIDPELVVLALDIPSMDGHLAALEMREHGKIAEYCFLHRSAKPGLHKMQHTQQERLAGLKSQLQHPQSIPFGA